MIYLDHAATAPTRPEVLEAMLPYFTEHWGNPSSLHAAGRRARRGLDEAREAIAGALGARPREIIFTSGGSEADNLAIKGVAWAGSARGRHIVTTAVEHKAVLHTCQVLERSGFEVTYLPVDRHGLVDPDELGTALTDRTVLVSIGYANNEVGTVQPMAEIGRVCRVRRIPLHTDAIQAAAHLPLDVDELGVSLLSLSAHKLGGPKGVGALYVRQGTQLLPQMQGGSQERQRRAGTESVALAVGFGVALGLARAEEPAHQLSLRDRLIAGITALPGAELTGHPVERLPNSASFVIDGVEGGDLVAGLDLEGIAASTGSACTSGSVEPSHVLLALGISPRLAHGSLRLTVGHATATAEIETTLETVAACVDRLRSTIGSRPAVA